jgi:hypothetical protein
LIAVIEAIVKTLVIAVVESNSIVRVEPRAASATAPAIEAIVVKWVIEPRISSAIAPLVPSPIWATIEITKT